MYPPNRQNIKGYELREQIGEGGFGVVYRAYQPVIDRDVALKFILPDLANQPEFIRSFEREAQMVARLEHPYIVPLYDYWREPSGAYLVMRWLRGGSLRHVIRSGKRWKLPAISHMVDQVAGALMIAHRSGVIHRDLKPDNILLDEDQNAYLADFGIAKIQDTDGNEAEVEVMVGSLTYSTPEQLRGEAVSPQTDLYSLGILVYEMLTGDLPFAGNVAVLDLINNHLHTPIPSLRYSAPNLEHVDALDAFIARATAKDPAQRFPDAMSMADELRRIVERDVALVQQGLSQGAVELQLSNPYKGLRAFQEADMADFFGRTGLIGQWLTRLGEDDPDSRFLTIIGPSGSGKSSAVDAGLVPALRQGALPGSADWFVVQMVPGGNPTQELAAALLRITANPLADLFATLTNDSRGLLNAVQQSLPDVTSQLLLVIDQFEELFTVTQDETERNRFLDSLVVAVRDPNSQLRVIITMRADFYDRPLLYANFGDLMRKRTEVVLPLSPSELKQAISGPAERIGLHLEPGLVEAIVQDVGQQPGTLPLLQYALTELFEQREGNRLTLEAYRNSGGVMSALARRADELYQALDASGQAACTQLFLRLVALGEGTEDTRRRTPQSEILSIATEHQAMTNVIDTFGKYRLLTFDRDPNTRSPTIEIAHEALIRNWGRLRSWLEASRDDLQIQRRLTSAAAEWQSAQRDASYLASGVRLDQFETWARTTTLALNSLESDYLTASVTEREVRQAADEKRKAQEFKTAQRAQTFERAARILGIVGVLAILATVIAVGSAVNANTQVQSAALTLTPIPATLTQVAQRIEDGNTRLESLRLASGAITTLQIENGNAETAALLAIRALKSGYLPQADGPLVQAVNALYTQQIFKGHTDQVIGLDVSRDGRWILTGGKDKTAILWDLQAGKSVQQFVGHTDAVNSVALSPDGKLAASASDDKTVRLWDVQSGKEIRQFTGHTDKVDSVAFSPDGNTILTGSVDKTARLWDVQTGKEVRELTLPSVVYSVTFSPNDKLILTGEDRLATLWDTASGAKLRDLMGIAGEVDGVAFSADSSQALTGARDGSARLWDVQSGQQRRQFVGHSDYVRSVAFSPDGKLALTGSRDRTARLWDIQTGKELRRFTGHTDLIHRAVFTPDGQSVLTSSWDGTVRQWNAQLNMQSRQFIGHTDSTVAVAISPDQRYVLTGSVDKTARLWDIQTGREIRRFVGHTNSVWYVSFSPDGRYILTGSRDKTARLWDVQTGQLLREFDGHTGVVYAANFSPDGKYVLTGSGDKTARLWDLSTGKEIREFTGHTNLIWSALFFPDGKHILTSSFDKTVRIWETDTGKEILKFTGHTDSVLGAAISPDGRTVLSGGSDRIARLWDASTGKEIRNFVGHTDALVNVAFSPDGRFIVTGSQDKTARLWDIQTGQEIRQFGNTGIVNSVAFSPDGRYVVTARFNGLVNLWDSDYHDLLEYACRQVFQDFTKQQRVDFAIDNSPTCPQFGTLSQPFAATLTPFPSQPSPVWTAIPSPTPSLVPSPTAVPTATPLTVLFAGQS